MITALGAVLRSADRHARDPGPPALGLVPLLPRCGHGPSAPPEAPVFSCAPAASTTIQPRGGRGCHRGGPGGARLARAAGEGAGPGTAGGPGRLRGHRRDREASARREAREETGIDVEGLAFLGSWPNLYEWRGVAYPWSTSTSPGASAKGRRPRPGTRSTRSSGCAGGGGSRDAGFPDHAGRLRPLPRSARAEKEWMSSTESVMRQIRGLQESWYP